MLQQGLCRRRPGFYSVAPDNRVFEGLERRDMPDAHVAIAVLRGLLAVCLPRGSNDQQHAKKHGHETHAGRDGELQQCKSSTLSHARLRVLH